MDSLWAVLIFRRMISPFVLQMLFWAGAGGTVYGSYVLFMLGHWAWPLALVFGILTCRVIFEMAILAFRTYDRLGDIRDALKAR